MVGDNAGFPHRVTLSSRSQVPSKLPPRLVKVGVSRPIGGCVCRRRLCGFQPVIRSPSRGWKGYPDFSAWGRAVARPTCFSLLSRPNVVLRPIFGCPTQDVGQLGARGVSGGYAVNRLLGISERPGCHFWAWSRPARGGTPCSGRSQGSGRSAGSLGPCPSDASAPRGQR